MRNLLTAATLAVALCGCGAILPYVMAAGQLAQWVIHAVDQVDAAKDTYFDARPSPDLEKQFDQAIAKTRQAAVALDEATLAADAAHDGDVEASKAHLIACYEELYRLVEAAGMLDASRGLLGAPPGVQVTIPDPATVEARLQ